MIFRKMNIKSLLKSEVKNTSDDEEENEILDTEENLDSFLKRRTIY